MKQLTRVIGELCLLGLGLLGVLNAQNPTQDAFTSAGVVTSPTVQGAGSSSFEQHNPFNGGLSAAMPLHHIGGRGEAGFDLVWNLQPGWLANRLGAPPTALIAIDPFPSNNIAGATTNGYALGGPGYVYSRTGATSWASCGSGSYALSGTVTTLNFVTPSGAQISLTDTATNGATKPVPNNPGNPCGSNQPSSWDAGRGTSFRSTDGSQIQFNATSNVQEQNLQIGGYGVGTISGNLVFPNGVTYMFSNSVVKTVEDRNGNTITLAYSQSLKVAIDWYLNVPLLTQITDSLGRITTIDYNHSACNGCLDISYYGAGGAQHDVQVITGSLGTSGNLRSGFSEESIGALFPTAGQPTSSNYNPTVASSIKMPDGSQYAFQYNQYGELARVTLPTGGAIEYDYVDGTGGANNGYQTAASGGVMIYRRLHERREYLGGGTGTSYSSKTDYAVTSGCGTTIETQSIYGTNGSNPINKIVHTMYGSPTDAMTPTSTGCNNWNEGLEASTQTGYPSTLVTVTNTYATQSGCMSNPQLTTKLTTIDGNMQMKTVYTYDGYSNVTDEKDYDWGVNAPGTAVLREAATAYLYQESGDSGYAGTTLNMVHLPYYQLIKNAGGTTIAETVWHYDEAAPTTIPGHQPCGT